jgi:hypothetical protein
MEGRGWGIKNVYINMKRSMRGGEMYIRRGMRRGRGGYE